MNQRLQRKNTTMKVGIQAYVFDCLLSQASYSGSLQLAMYLSILASYIIYTKLKYIIQIEIKFYEGFYGQENLKLVAAWPNLSEKIVQTQFWELN